MTTVTNNYSLVQPVVGGDINLWGGELNNGVIAALDSILGSVLAVTMTSSDVTLTPAQFQNAIFNVSGSLTGNRKFIIPLQTNSLTVACGGRFVVINNTNAIFTTVTQASGSTGVTIPVGFAAFLYSDGTNVNYCTNGLPAFAAASNGNPNSQLAGTAGSAVTNASLAYDFTNNLIYVCTTTGTTSTAVWVQPTVAVPRGFDTVVNLGLNVIHTGGNLLNLSINQANGSAATPANPIIAPFQSVAGANMTGVPTQVNITGALSMTTAATGATFGTSNNIPFRVWFALFNNAGVAVPAMRVCSLLATGNVYGVAEYGVANTVAVGAGATSAGVWYTPSGTSLTNCAYRLIGYCDYANGLATVGTYTSDPTSVVLFGPGIPKPGECIQMQTAVQSTEFSTTSASFVLTNTSVTVQPASVLNLFIVNCSGGGTVSSGGAAVSGVFQLARNSTSILFGTRSPYTTFNQNAYSASCIGVDAPQTLSAVTYSMATIQGAGSANTTFWNNTAAHGSGLALATQSCITAQEIMG